MGRAGWGMLGGGACHTEMGTFKESLKGGECTSQADASVPTQI